MMKDIQGVAVTHEKSARLENAMRDGNSQDAKSYQTESTDRHRSKRRVSVSADDGFPFSWFCCFRLVDFRDGW